MRFINLTPHAIVLRGADGTETTVPPSGQLARVTSKPGLSRGGLLRSPAPTVPVYGPPEWGEIEGLSTFEADTILLVSALVLGRTKRPDVVAPGTGPGDGAVRDAEGRVVAVTRLIAAV